MLADNIPFITWEINDLKSFRCLVVSFRLFCSFGVCYFPSFCFICSSFSSRFFLFFFCSLVVYLVVCICLLVCSVCFALLYLFVLCLRNYSEFLGFLTNLKFERFNIGFPINISSSRFFIKKFRNGIKTRSKRRKSDKTQRVFEPVKNRLFPKNVENKKKRHPSRMHNSEPSL